MPKKVFLLKKIHFDLKIYPFFSKYWVYSRVYKIYPFLEMGIYFGNGYIFVNIPKKKTNALLTKRVL